MVPFENESVDPFTVFGEWLSEAEKSEPNDPTAGALATATLQGAPSVRMVLTKGVDNRGVRFFTNVKSQKGSELHHNPVAALCIHWKSLRRQVRFSGAVEVLSCEETATYFHSRSRASQISAAVSAQSHPLASRENLDAAIANYTMTLGEKEVPLPETWGGYLLVPDAIEFWSDGKDRLHDRVKFTRDGQGWTAQRLYP